METKRALKATPKACVRSNPFDPETTAMDSKTRQESKQHKEHNKLSEFTVQRILQSEDFKITDLTVCAFESSKLGIVLARAQPDLEHDNQTTRILFGSSVVSDLF